MLLLHRFCGRPERGSGRFSAPSAHGILGGVGAAPTAGSGACRPASATLCRGDPPVRRRTARLPGASVRRDEPPRLPPWLRRRPSRTARRDRSRVRGLTHLSRPRVRLSDPRLPFTRRHHRHGRRRPRGMHCMLNIDKLLLLLNNSTRMHNKIIGVYRLSQSKHTILATSDASLAAPALGIYVASIHIFMFDDGCSATIAATRAVSYTHLTLPTICSV